jgi:hypothetical protein
MTNEENNLEDKVMADIKSGRVKLRSKYVYLAEKLGLGSVFIFTAILAILFFNLLLFYLKSSDNLFYLSFGSRGIFAFLESFPYLLIISLICLVFGAGFIMKKSDVTYKKPFGYLALALVVFIMVAGAVLAFTNIAERIERGMRGPHPGGMFFKPFFGPGPGDGNRGMVGRVVNIEGQIITIQTPRNIQLINLSTLKEDVAEKIGIGAFVMVIGEKIPGMFNAEKIRIVHPDEMPIILENIHEQFGEMKPCERRGCRMIK